MDMVVDHSRIDRRKVRACYRAFQRKQAILADACEALIGAAFLDAGFEAASEIVARHWRAKLSASANPPIDAKTALQEWLQGRKMKLPQYQVINTTGTAHNQVFHVECLVAELQLTARGSGASRRAAEQAAASAMLAQLKVKQA